MVQVDQKLSITAFAQSVRVVLIKSTAECLLFLRFPVACVYPCDQQHHQAGYCRKRGTMAAGSGSQEHLCSGGFSRYHHIGGQGATMPLALFMLRAKLKIPVLGARHLGSPPF